ncbi:MAG: asparagine synthase (glutamine-hydrolyzing) [Acidobacteria bacterium]|nr:MAG: asparagine synthase (glutamine-hydrolyzing) [Acidobacteriota bacterium]
MCGLSAIAGCDLAPLQAMIACQQHRGPDVSGSFADRAAGVALGHNRLSILDLSAAGRQPMRDAGGRYRLILNGEIYNYRELRAELRGDWDFRSRSDAEVLLAAWARWGEGCLERLLGMFAFVLWDARERTLYAVRDRFGVKPLYLHRRGDGGLLLASEIRALHAAGVPRQVDEAAWARYLARGVHDQGTATFWRGVERLAAGHRLRWRDGRCDVRRWYDLPSRVGPQLDPRPDREVEEEYRALLEESVALRFRSDVPVGINLSGGLDSSLLLALVQRVRGAQSDARVFTFTCGDERYDELPWVERMLARTRHPLTVCRLEPAAVPALAASVMAHQDEPFGGLPTLAYARLFERARRDGVIVLLDGQGMDEQLAGYDYYRTAPDGAAAPAVQGSRDPLLRPECLAAGFRALAEDPPPAAGGAFGDPLRDLQLRDLTLTKLPRALRFNDRVSMRASCELREPFLDHRLVELALRQPARRKIDRGQGKILARRIARTLMPGELIEAPKRPLQTPQREWLRGPLRGWATDLVESALQAYGGSWLEAGAVRRELDRFLAGEGDNSFYVWQWMSLGLCAGRRGEARPAAGVAAREGAGL